MATRGMSCKTVYDAVEIPEDRSGWTTSNVPEFVQRLERWRISRIIRSVDRIMTVGDGLRDWTATRYGIAKPDVIRNCRYFEAIAPDDAIRRDCGLMSEDRLALYLNSVYQGQGLEQFVESVAFLPSHIHIATLGPLVHAGFLEMLKEKIAFSGCSERIHILEPKPPTEMIQYAAGADIGVIPRQNTSLNNYYSLPNRIFELIMARLPIAGPNLADMKTFIETNGIGMIFDETDPEDIARVIKLMLEDTKFADLKRDIESSAELYCWENEGRRYVDVIEETAGIRPATTNLESHR